MIVVHQKITELEEDLENMKINREMILANRKKVLTTLDKKTEDQRKNLSFLG